MNSFFIIECSTPNQELRTNEKEVCKNLKCKKIQKQCQDEDDIDGHFIQLIARLRFLRTLHK